MYAVVAQLIIFSTIGCAFPSANVRDDVIWFPINDYENGYVSVQGEYFVPKPSDPWFDDRNYNAIGARQSRRPFRSVSAATHGNDFGSNTRDKEFVVTPEGYWDRSEIKRAIGAEEPLLFPGETNADQKRGRDCKTNCLGVVTPEYNPVCGTDKVNYHNLGFLKCEQLCGKRVKFGHYGVCGGALPGIFRPSPRRPGFTTERTTENLASGDRTGDLFQLLRI